LCECSMVGRPSDFTEDIAATICELLMDGLSMRQICLRDDMPHRSTVANWLERHTDFSTKCARAREWQADIMDDLILETANNCTSETAAADRVKIGAFQWRAGRLAPKVYGDKLTTEHTGPGGGPVQSVTVVTTDPVEAAKVYAKLMGGE
jgi:hypothetical protein